MENNGIGDLRQKEKVTAKKHRLQSPNTYVQ